MEKRNALQAHAIKITVLKKHFHPEFVQQYAAQPEIWTECTHFAVGDTFQTDPNRPWDMPEGFCGWAWADIQKIVYGMARGGQESFVTCCTDGYRPVVFALERVTDFN